MSTLHDLIRFGIMLAEGGSCGGSEGYGKRDMGKFLILSFLDRNIGGFVIK